MHLTDHELATRLATSANWINDSLCQIASDQPDAGDQLRVLHSTAKSHAAKLRELIAAIEAAAIEHIEATGEDIALEDGKRWYIGVKKKVAPIDDTAIAHAILKATEGDVGRFTTGADGVLCANPWKQGAVKSIVGVETFATLFTTTIEKELNTGVAVKVLRVADPAYATKGIRHDE